MWPLVLVLSAALQDPALTLAARDEPGPPPIIVCEGSGTVPDGSLAIVSLFYHRKLEGTHIAQKRAAVAGGKLVAEFAPFADRNLPGEYFVTAFFFPPMQPRGSSLKQPLQFDHAFRIGTPEEEDAERRRRGRELMEAAAAMDELGRRVEEAYRKMSARPDPDLWRNQAAAWNREADGVVAPLVGRPEYAMLDFGFILRAEGGGAAGLLPELREILRMRIEGCSRALAEGGKPSQQLATVLNDLRNASERDLSAVREFLRLPSQKPEALREKAGALVDDVRRAREAALAGAARADEFRALQTRLVRGIMELQAATPPEAHPLLARLSEAVASLDRAARGEKNAAPTDEALTALRLEILNSIR